MRIVVTGATGAVGRRLVTALRARGDEVTVLARNPDRATELLGVPAVVWDPVTVPPPADALAGADGVVHLAGEPVAQRWNDQVKRRIHESREIGTRHLVTALAALPDGDRPSVLVSASASGYYGPCGDEIVTEQTPPGSDFLAIVCVHWEQEAAAAAQHGVRACLLRTGIVLDPRGGALAKLVPVFRLGAGGPVAGGRQYMPWIHADDLTSLYLRALDDAGWSGPVNASAPEPVTNAEFSRTLGRALHRPAVVPVPALALRTLYGEMASVLTTGQRQVPRRALDARFAFAHPALEPALADLLG